MPEPRPNHRSPEGAAPAAWLLGGPTACGKTAVAHELARRHGLEILSADSMLVYAGMDIGTAKPTPAEREGIPYHGIDLVSPAEHCSAGVFLRAAARAAASAAANGRQLLVVGGTGLYFDLLLHGLDEGESDGTPPAVRARWQALFVEGGLAAIHAEAERRSPGVLARMADPENPRRVLRVLERLDQGLAPLPTREPAASGAEPPFPVLGIAAPVLARRIEERIAAMFDAGLLPEVAALRQRFPRWSDTATTAIGYAEAVAVLEGSLDADAARERIAARTRQLAKRQRTWFRNRMNVVWVDGPADAADISRAADDVERIWRQHGPHTLHLPAASDR